MTHLKLLQNKNDDDAENGDNLKDKFLEMKTYEILLESTVQFLLNGFNILTLQNGSNTSILSYITLLVSLMSLLSGVFGTTDRCSQAQSKVALKPLGRLLVTLILASYPFMLFRSIVLVNALVGHNSVHEDGLPIVSYVFLGRMCSYSTVYFLDEIVYILKPCRQRLICYCQIESLWCKMQFVFFQPTFVNLKRKKVYIIPFILVKVVLSSMYLTEVYNYTPSSTLEYLLYSVYYTFAATLNVLYILYLCRQELFFTVKLEPQYNQDFKEHVKTVSGIVFGSKFVKDNFTNVAFAEGKEADNANIAVKKNDINDASAQDLPFPNEDIGQKTPTSEEDMMQEDAMTKEPINQNVEVCTCNAPICWYV